MRSKRTILVVVILSLALIVSSVLASGVVNLSKLSLNSNFLQPAQGGGTEVFVDPRWYVRDYALQPVGSTFTVHVNVTSVTDLFTWQVNVTYNPAILSINKVLADEFLARSAVQTSSEVLGSVINSTDNTKGTSGFAETLLGSSTGVTGSGRLVSIQFLVVGYGKTDLDIALTGNLATTLFDSTGASLAFTTVNGTFDNRIKGDITGPGGAGVYDGIVNAFDLGYVGSAFGSNNTIADYTGPSGFPDGIVNAYDLGGIGANFGRHYP